MGVCCSQLNEGDVAVEMAPDPAHTLTEEEIAEAEEAEAEAAAAEAERAQREVDALEAELDAADNPTHKSQKQKLQRKPAAAAGYIANQSDAQQRDSGAENGNGAAAAEPVVAAEDGDASGMQLETPPLGPASGAGAAPGEKKSRFRFTFGTKGKRVRPQPVPVPAPVPTSEFVEPFGDHDDQQQQQWRHGGGDDEEKKSSIPPGSASAAWAPVEPVLASPSGAGEDDGVGLGLSHADVEVKFDPNAAASAGSGDERKSNGRSNGKSKGGGQMQLQQASQSPPQGQQQQQQQQQQLQRQQSPQQQHALRNSPPGPPLDEPLLASLKRIPLLAKLSRTELIALSRSLVPKQFRPGYKMVVEGDIGPECFVISRGGARVTKWQPEARAEVELGTLGPGDYFGETALLSETESATRGATISVLPGSPALVYLLTRAHVQTVLGNQGLNMSFQKRAGISAEVHNPGEAAPPPPAAAATPVPLPGMGHRGAVAGGGLAPSPGLNGQAPVGGAGGAGGGGVGGSSAPLDSVRQKSADTRKMLLEVVRESVLFANMDAPSHELLVDTMWLRNVSPGETIIAQGDIGEHWYVVDSGSFDILLNSKTDHPRVPPTKVGTRERGAGVGELALLYNAPRAATIRCSTGGGGGAVWVLDRWTFRHMITSAAEAKRTKYESFLRGVAAFDVLLDSERSRLAEALEEVSFPAGARIVTQGENGDTFFVIQSGTVSVSKEGQGEVTRLGPGQFFGEKSVINNEPRAATVTALGAQVVCLSLKSEAFKDLLGSMDDIFRNRQQQYLDDDKKSKERDGGEKGAAGVAAGAKEPGGSPKSSDGTGSGSGGAGGGPGHKHSNSLSDSLPSSGRGAGGRGRSNSAAEQHALLTHLKLADLKVLGTLGKGSFGHVQLVKDRTGSTYALKIVSKQAAVNLGQQEHIMNEKRTMAQLNHPFLVRLFATFQDADRLYFLLEASLGGELFTVLRSRSSFPETTARFYAAGIVLAFEYMHAKGIVYRDLKPENLLLDSKGYLKVTDFGFAKKVGDGRTWTLCGTPDYLAPEVVSGQGHGKGVDWWTLGILIYEMLAGYPPFYDEDPIKTYGKIMSGTITFPMHFSKQAMDLIRKLLNPKSGKRYGCLAGGATLIKNHPWFAKFDWQAFLSRRLPAPIVLPVKSPEDMSNFDRSQEQTVKVVKYSPDPSAPKWEKDF